MCAMRTQPHHRIVSISQEKTCEQCTSEFAECHAINQNQVEIGHRREIKIEMCAQKNRVFVWPVVIEFHDVCAFAFGMHRTKQTNKQTNTDSLTINTFSLSRVPNYKNQIISDKFGFEIRYIVCQIPNQ